MRLEINFDEWQRLEVLVNKELRRAEAKFPDWPEDPVHAAAIVAEEAGELVKAALQYFNEDGNEEKRQAMAEEATQVATTALRFLAGMTRGRGYEFKVDYDIVKPHLHFTRVVPEPGQEVHIDWNAKTASAEWPRGMRP